MTPLSSENQTRTANHLEERKRPGVSSAGVRGQWREGFSEDFHPGKGRTTFLKPSYEAKTDPPHLLVFFFHLKG